MRRLTLLVAAATARPDKNASAYFDAASSLWPPASTARFGGAAPARACRRLRAVSGCGEGGLLSRLRQCDY